MFFDGGGGVGGGGFFVVKVAGNDFMQERSREFMHAGRMKEVDSGQKSCYFLCQEMGAKGESFIQVSTYRDSVGCSSRACHHCWTVSLSI